MAVGAAVVTIGGDLNARWVVHAVGPNYNRLKSDEEGDWLLYSAYKTSMEVAKGKGVKTMAFSLLSAGVYRGDRPLREVLKIAVRGVKENVWESLESVALIAFTRMEQMVLKAAVEDVMGVEGGERGGGERDEA